LKPLCGCFINMIPVIGTATRPTNTVQGALDHVYEQWVSMASCADVPFLAVMDKLVKEHNITFSPSRNAVFQAMLNYRVDLPKLIPDDRFRFQPVHHLEGHMDFDLQVDDCGDNLVFTHNYCTSLFKPSTAECFVSHFFAILRAITRPAWLGVEIAELPKSQAAVDDVEDAPAMSWERAILQFGQAVY